MRSDNEPVLLALKEAVRRETDVEIVLEAVPGAPRAPSGERVGRERGEERAGSAPGDQGRVGEQAQQER